MKKARQMCEKAIALDPKYADAYALLGFTYLIDMNNQWSRDPHISDRIFQRGRVLAYADPSARAAREQLSGPHSNSNARR